MRAAAAGLLVTAGTVLVLLCVTALFTLRGAVNRLHAVSLASTAAPPFFALAVLVAHGFSALSLKALLAAALLLVLSPQATHAVARSLRIRERGGVRPDGG